MGVIMVYKPTNITVGPHPVSLWFFVAHHVQNGNADGEIQVYLLDDWTNPILRMCYHY